MVRTLDPQEQGHLGPWDLHLNKFGKGLPGNATYLIKAPKPTSSGDEYLYVHFIFEPKTPATGNFQPQGHHLNKLGRGRDLLMLHINFKHLSQVVLKKKIF